MSHLNHANTVKVFLYGELEDGSLYIVMEFLEGRNLHQTVRKGGPLSYQRALPILVQVCGALEEAHQKGIVHRDLKPENIFLCRDPLGAEDFPKVLDFGLAKVTEREMHPGSIILTQEGMVFGTPEFMSPEQAQGRVLDARSDLYSLAVILYEALTGKLPFDAKTPMEYIQHHVASTPIDLNSRVPDKTFPPLLAQIMAKALAKRPEDRFQTAAEFAAALQQVIHTGEPQTSAPPPRLSPPMVQADALTSPAQATASALLRPPVALIVAVAATSLVLGVLLTVLAMKFLF